MTEKLLKPFRDERIPVTGFVNECRSVAFGPEGIREVLELWLDAGAELGNHSHSHLNINNVPLSEFTADITRGEPIVRAALEARGRTLRRGYTFVTLDEALVDDVYRLPEEYVGRGGFSWIHRWTRTKGLPITAEPEPPAWVTEGWANRAAP